MFHPPIPFNGHLMLHVQLSLVSLPVLFSYTNGGLTHTANNNTCQFSIMQHVMFSTQSCHVQQLTHMLVRTSPRDVYRTSSCNVQVATIRHPPPLHHVPYVTPFMVLMVHRRAPPLTLGALALCGTTSDPAFHLFVCCLSTE